MVPLRVATRGSALARWQAERVASLVLAASPGRTVELVVVDTAGDRRLDLPIWAIGGKGVFAKEVQAAVLDGRADVAVHSAKDLPSATPPGLVLASVPERGDARDALVGCTLDSLREGAEVATGSLRRQAQLAALRPDLRFVGLRGNMATRLAAAAHHDAVVVAAVALDRLGHGDRIAQRFEAHEMVPQVAQGALAVECRADDDATAALLAGIDDPRARRCVDAERGFLAELGGDCSLPAGAHATLEGDDVVLAALLASPDGSVVLRHQARSASDPGCLGAGVARYLLDDLGGAAVLGRSG